MAGYYTCYITNSIESRAKGHLEHSKHKGAQGTAYVPPLEHSYSILTHLTKVDAAVIRALVAYSLRYL